MPTYRNLHNISRQERNQLRREMAANNRVFFGVVEPYGLDPQTGIRTLEIGDMEKTNEFLDKNSWHTQLQRIPFSHRGIMDSNTRSHFLRLPNNDECGYLTDAEAELFSANNKLAGKTIRVSYNVPGTGAQLGFIWNKAAELTWRLHGTDEETNGIPLSQEESNSQIHDYLFAFTRIPWDERPNLKMVEAVLLRANEIASHPHYNWCVQACGGNGLDIHGPHNWHLPSIVMALAGGPTPGRVEHAMQNKDVVSLLLNFGNAFRQEYNDMTDPNYSTVGSLAAFAMQSLAEDQRASGNQVNRILAEGFHLQNLWDICNANPDLVHNGLHPASNEENLSRLNAQNPRIEGLGIQMAEEITKQILDFENTYQLKLSESLVIVDLEGKVLYGTPDEDLERQLEVYDRPRRMRQDTDHPNKLLINETMVDNDGYYIGPDLSNYTGNVEVHVPCFYAQANNSIRINGDLILRDGKGGNFLASPEAGTIFATDGNLVVTGNIISKNEEGGLGAQRFCLLSAGSVTAGEQIDLATANIKATFGGITAKKIDASAILCHGKITVEQGIYASRIAVGNGLEAKEIHSDWLQGTGSVVVKNKITLMFGLMLNGPVTADAIVILNPRQIPNSANYKAPVVCTRLRVQTIEPNGVYQPLQGIDHPVNITLAPGGKEHRLLI